MQPLIFQNYIDTMLRWWVDWSENVLNEEHDEQFSHRRGFEAYMQPEVNDGNYSSTHRTRAREFFRMGFLRAELQGGTGGGLPDGWAMIQSNQHVHSRLGYCAYALGKLLRIEDSLDNVSPRIRKAISVLCFIITTETGFNFEGRYFLTSSVYQYVHDNFNTLPQIQQKSLYLAAAMICTMYEPPYNFQFMEAYFENSKLTWLLLKTKDESTVLTESNLYTQVKLAMQEDNISPARLYRYWALPQRGLYNVAREACDDLLRATYGIERESIQRDVENPFSILEQDGTKEKPVMESLEKIFTENGVRPLWRHAMQTLEEGIVEALRFVRGQDGLDRFNQPRTLYGHDIDDQRSIGQSQVEVSVEMSQLPFRPQLGDRIILNDLTYEVEETMEEDNNLILKLQLMK